MNKKQQIENFIDIFKRIIDEDKYEEVIKEIELTPLVPTYFKKGLNIGESEAHEIIHVVDFNIKLRDWLVDKVIKKNNDGRIEYFDADFLTTYNDFNATIEDYNKQIDEIRESEKNNKFRPITDFLKIGEDDKNEEIEKTYKQIKKEDISNYINTYKDLEKYILGFEDVIFKHLSVMRKVILDWSKNQDKPTINITNFFILTLIFDKDSVEYFKRLHESEKSYILNTISSIMLKLFYKRLFGC